MTLVRQMREPDEKIEQPIVAAIKKPIGPVSDELILPPPSKTIPPQKDIRGAGEEMQRSYDRRRDDGYRERGSDRRGGRDRDRDREDRDRYALKNQYATNLPPRLQRQAEMQYREQGQRNPRDGRSYDDPRVMRQSDRPDELFDRDRRGSDRRTPEDSNARPANVRSENGSWRNSKREERRDSSNQIELDSVSAPAPQLQQSSDVTLAESKSDDPVPSRKTSHDSSSAKNVESATPNESGLMPSAIGSTTVSPALTPIVTLSVSSGPQPKSAKQINKPDSKPSNNNNNNNNNQTNVGTGRNLQNNSRQLGGSVHPSQPDLKKTPVVSQTAQQQAPALVMYPPTVPAAGVPSIRAVRTAYGPPTSKAAFGGVEAVTSKPTPSNTPPQASVPQQSQKSGSESKAPILHSGAQVKGEFADGYEKNNRRGRTLSNASNKSREPRRKEVCILNYYIFFLCENDEHYHNLSIL